MLEKVLGSYAISSGQERGKEEIEQKVAEEKLVSCDMPEEDGLPFLDGAATLCQENER
jgi:hypothetical protein